MKKQMKTILALLLVLGLTSCQAATPGDDQNQNQTGESSDGYEPTIIGTNELGWEIPEEPISFSYYSSSTEPGEYDSVMYDYLKEEFNVEIEKITYSQDMTERLNIMLASNEYPDVIADMPATMAEQFIDQDRTVDVSGLLDEYAPNLKENLGVYIGMLEDENGEINALPSNIGTTIDTKGADFGVRYDYWLETEMPIYTNFEEFYEVCKEILNEHPTTEAGDATYALTSMNQGASWYSTMCAYLGFKNGYKEDEDGTLTHWVNTEEGEMIATYINRFYREGMIDPTWQDNGYEEMITQLSSERVIANIGTWWHLYVGGHETWVLTDENYSPEKRFLNVPFQETEKTPSLISNNYLRTNRTIITDKCDNVEAVLTYFNFENSKLGRILNAHGVPSENNIWDIEDGVISMVDSSIYDIDRQTYYHTPREMSGSGAFWITAPGYMATEGDEDFSVYGNDLIKSVSAYEWVLNPEAVDVTKFDESLVLQEELDMEYERPDYLWDSTIYSVTYPANSDEAILDVTITDTLLTEWAKVVTSATEEECIAQFEEMKNKLNDVGLEDLTTYVQGVVSENKAKIG